MPETTRKPSPSFVALWKDVSGTLGPDHPGMLEAVRDMGQLLHDKGELRSVGRIGRHLLDAGNYKEAEPFLRRDLEACERVRGPA